MRWILAVALWAAFFVPAQAQSDPEQCDDEGEIYEFIAATFPESYLYDRTGDESLLFLTFRSDVASTDFVVVLRNDGLGFCAVESFEVAKGEPA